MVSVTSRLTTGVTETAGGGAVPWAAATLHDTAIMSAQKAAFGTADPSIEVLLAARVTPRILRFTGIRRRIVQRRAHPLYASGAAASVLRCRSSCCLRRRLLEPTHRKYAQDLSWLNMFRLTSSQGLRRRSGALSLAHGLAIP